MIKTGGARLRNLFAEKPPLDLKQSYEDFACVSLILREGSDGLELAFIRRARNPQDPWSGHVAFPGGRAEQTDAHDLETALRETREEVGWELSAAHFLGYLTDLQARSRAGMLSFFLRPLVFRVEGELPLDTFDPREVEEVFWVSIAHLNDIRHRTSINVPSRGFDLPGIRFPEGSVLWGLTYMITQELLEKLNAKEAP